MGLDRQFVTAHPLWIDPPGQMATMGATLQMADRLTKLELLILRGDEDRTIVCALRDQVEMEKLGTAARRIWRGGGGNE